MSALDKADMLGVTMTFDRQCRQALEIGQAAKLNIDPERVTDIVVMGMGGSGISGDVIRILFEDQLKVPLLVNRDYQLPAFVGPKTLAIAASYSGDTEETLSSFNEALDRGAQVMVVSSGGRISKMAAEKDLSLITIPAGFQPRAALGYLSIPSALALHRLGLAPDTVPGWEETIKALAHLAGRYGPEVPVAQNEAKQLALRLLGKMPVMYGSQGLTGLATFRWRCQFNENSKVAGGWNVLPELDHNEITGWQELQSLSKQFRLIFLRDRDEHPQVKKRVQATKDLIADQFDGVDEFESGGDSRAARFFSLVCLGDFASIYLALLNGIDPSPVERIELLKKRLAT